MSEEETEKITLDLSRKQLKKVPKQEDAQNVRILKLDENELQKIDNIDSYLKIETLSLSKNQLLRMYGVCRLHCLRELNLSFNGILSIEGLKDCIHLRHLNLEGNNIKTIEHLNNNVKLEYLNLGENGIGSVSDISFLKSLKELYLHGNRLTHLRQCDKYLPTSLEILTLAKNNVSDLNEICTLSNLCNLYSITISENPCVSMSGNTDTGFDHRPFVLNWCMSVKVIDGFMVDPIESLKAEWLYSQGRGRQFRVGEQTALAKYLSSVCPLIGKALENENERKLRLILSKAQQHQRQLQEEISEHSISSSNNSPSSGRKKASSRIQSPRFSRLSGRQGSPDSMISSYHGHTSSEQVANSNHLQMTTSLIENIKNDSLMSQSFDGGSSITSGVVTAKTNNMQESTPRTATPNSTFTEQSVNNPPSGGPLTAASKMVPVPETLMSPDVCPASVAQRVTVSAINTQIQNSKMNKNKDNKLNSPKMRSPHLKRNTERSSPVMSPRRLSSPNCGNQVNTSNHNKNAIGDNQMKSRLISNSVHVSTTDGDASVAISSDEDSDHMNMDKLKTIRNKAAQRCQQQQQQQQQHQNDEAHLPQNTESSAVVIQKTWRGYRTRKKTKDIAEKLLKLRTNEYIDKLTKDMEMTKAQLENERKIQQLQMQAINALWKKVSTMQGGCIISNSVTLGEGAEGSASADSSKVLSLDNSSTAVVHDLAKTCSMLTNQENVKKLLSAGVADALSAEKCDSAATQTEIVAVHTPQIENHSNFPFTKVRPSSLPLEKQKNGTGCSGIENRMRQEKSYEQVENESGIVSEDMRSTDVDRSDIDVDVDVDVDLFVEKTDHVKEHRGC